MRTGYVELVEARAQLAEAETTLGLARCAEREGRLLLTDAEAEFRRWRLRVATLEAAWQEENAALTAELEQAREIDRDYAAYAHAS